MNAHDDFLDVQAAWERYEKAYTRWDQAVNGKIDVDARGRPRFNPLKLLPPASHVQQKRAATILANRTADLIKAAHEALRWQRRRGWLV